MKGGIKYSLACTNLLNIMTIFTLIITLVTLFLRLNRQSNPVKKRAGSWVCDDFQITEITQRQLSIPFSTTSLLRLSSLISFFALEIFPHRNNKSTTLCRINFNSSRFMDHSAYDANS